MRIFFNPYIPVPGLGAGLTIEKSNDDQLRINGEWFDFNPLVDGGAIPDDAIPCQAIVGPVERVGGHIHITLRLPVPGDCSDPWMCFPEPMTVTEDGPIDVPFATFKERSEQTVEGGTKFTTTTHRWRLPDLVDEVFVPNAPPEPSATEEPADVEP